MTSTTGWSEDDLRTFAATDDVYVPPFREDGTTLGTPTRIWSVVVGHDRHIRPAHGPTSRWDVAATTPGAGRIRVDEVEHDDHFAPADEQVLDAVDAAYADTSSVEVMVGPGPRAATLRVFPR
jgi:hypothetical protein